MDKKMEKLLKLLQDDAKLTVQELAVMLDMTEAEVAAAIHKFEKDGVIKGYRTLINWEPVSYTHLTLPTICSV